MESMRRTILCLARIGVALAIGVPLAALGQPASSVIQKSIPRQLAVVTLVNGVDTPAMETKAVWGTATMGQNQVLSVGAVGREVPDVLERRDVGEKLKIVPFSFGNGTKTRAQILALASATLLDPESVRQRAGALGRLAFDYSLGTASLTYDQEIRPAGAVVRSMRLVWTLLVDRNGNRTFGAPRIVDNDPVHVYMQYTSFAVANGLPPTWQYPQAGELAYQLRNTRNQPVTDWVRVATGGVFDEPQPTGTETVDPNLGIKCLLNNSLSASCPTGYPDARAVIDQLGASGVLLEYARMVQPYQDPVEGQPGVFQARVGLSVDQRILHSTRTCGSSTTSSYENQGRYGFQLQTRVERWTLSSNEQAQYVDSRESALLSPEQSYAKTVAVDASQASDPSIWLVNPLEDSPLLVRANETPGIVYLSPVSFDNSSSGGVLFNTMKFFCGSFRFGECMGESWRVTLYSCSSVPNQYERRVHVFKFDIPPDWQATMLAEPPLLVTLATDPTLAAWCSKNPGKC